MDNLKVSLSFRWIENMKPKHNYPQIEVIWADHWFDPEEVDRKEMERMAKSFDRPTSGYLVFENRRMIVICSTVDTDDDGGETFSERNYLMKRAILSRSDK